MHKCTQAHTCDGRTLCSAISTVVNFTIEKFNVWIPNNFGFRVLNHGCILSVYMEPDSYIWACVCVLSAMVVSTREDLCRRRNHRCHSSFGRVCVCVCVLCFLFIRLSHLILIKMFNCNMRPFHRLATQCDRWIFAVFCAIRFAIFALLWNWIVECEHGIYDILDLFLILFLEI